MILAPCPEISHFDLDVVWPTEQDRIPATHLLDVPNLKWDKVEDGKYYMVRKQYDFCNEQLCN